MFVVLIIAALLLPPSVSIGASQSVVKPGEVYAYTVAGTWEGPFTFVPEIGPQAQIVAMPSGCDALSCTLVGDGTERSYSFVARARTVAQPGCIPFGLRAQEGGDTYLYVAACVWYHDDHRVWLPLVAR